MQSTVTTMAVTVSSTDSQLAQDTHQRLADNSKRLRSKSVTWAPEEKLNQVRLFAAEDAPSLSGSVLQDLLEAKKSKFMHALAPVSAEDLPPGFEGVATKRARLDTSTVIVMVTQIPWRYPQRFVYDPLWQVAIGDESSEVALQARREVRVLEAVYPRFTAIPLSSAEPQELPPQTDDSHVLQIPLIPIEDEEEGIEDDYATGADTKPFAATSQDSSGKPSLSYPPGYSPPGDDKYVDAGGNLRNLSGSSSTTRSSSDFTTNFIKNADPDVAAAAAAAYAVLKAKESGKLIDQDLLVKILSNPLLIDTLTASNPSLKNQFGDVLSGMPPYRENANGNGFKMRPDPFDEGVHIGGLQVMQGRQRIESIEGKIMSGLQGNPMTWGLNASTSVNSQSRSFPMVGPHEQLNTGKVILGQMKGAYGTATGLGHPYSLPRQDMSRELIQQHGMGGMLSADAQVRQSAPPGSKGQPWLPNTVLSAGTASRNTLTSQDRPIGPKSRKQCFFYNTPKGCRNGIYCNFSHESVPDKPYLERTNSDTIQPERIPRIESSDTVKQ